MKKYTKLCLATLCFISSLSAYADGYKGEAPPLVPVSIPTFAGGFEFTLGALYMTPESSNTDYLNVYHEEIVGSNTLTDVDNFNVNTKYNWGFLLGLGYVFPGTANDVKLDWMYFHNDFNSSEFLLGHDQLVWFTPGFTTDLNGNQILDASGRIDYKFDAVDLTFGQYLNIGSRLQTRLFTGLRYMRLDSDLSTDYAILQNSTGSVTNTFVDGTANSSFNGLGPMIGIKADYYLGAGFGLSGVLDGALLVGQLGLDAGAQVATFTDSSTPPPGFVLSSATNVDYNYDTQKVVAPGFDAKFGLNYKYQFNNGTLLGVELGYQVTKYIDVVAQVDGKDAFMQAASLVQFTGFDHRDADVTNFRLAGPYLTMNVKI